MNVNSWSVSIPAGMLVTNAITLISSTTSDPVPLWGFFLFLAFYTLLIRFAPAVIPALCRGFSVPLRPPRRTATSGRLDIAAVRRESYALGLPFPESDGSLSWPPELSEPERQEPVRPRFRKDAEWADRDEWLQRWTEPVSAAAYDAWLQRWLRRGGQITHDYDRNLPDGNVRRLVAEPDHWPYRWCGALSIELIVPARLSHVVGRIPRSFHGQWGHSTVYVFTKTGGVDILGDWVPTYRNVRGR